MGASLASYNSGLLAGTSSESAHAHQTVQFVAQINQSEEEFGKFLQKYKENETIKNNNIRGSALLSSTAEGMGMLHAV